MQTAKGRGLSLSVRFRDCHDMKNDANGLLIPTLHILQMPLYYVSMTTQGIRHVRSMQ